MWLPGITLAAYCEQLQLRKRNCSEEKIDEQTVLDCIKHFDAKNNMETLSFSTVNDSRFTRFCNELRCRKTFESIWRRWYSQMENHQTGHEFVSWLAMSYFRKTIFVSRDLRFARPIPLNIKP